MKPLLALLIASSFTLHAETEKEFGERVSKAWNSKSTPEILALFGDPAKLDPDFKKSITTGLIDFQLKSGFDDVEVSVTPPDPFNNKSFVGKGKIVYLPSETVGQVKVTFLQDGKPTTTGNMTSAFIKSSSGTFALATPTMKTFEWTGEEMPMFTIGLKPEKAEAYIPEVVVVVEKFGRIDWLMIQKNTSLPAHKIISIIISPTPDSESLTVEITKDMEKAPVYKKTVSTSKGAVIPIDSNTP